MKTCNKCQVERSLDRFSVNDFGRYKNPCKDCQSVDSLKRYNDKKEKLNLVQSEVETTSNESEKLNSTERKCKDFFFYQHG